MNVLAWVLSGLLAVGFLAFGGTKLATSHDKLLTNPNMAWAADFTDPQVKAIGALEVLGAIGLVLPWLLGVVPVLTPLAAVGLVLVMVGAVVVHARRGELKQALPINTVLGALAAVVAVLRFGQL